MEVRKGYKKTEVGVIPEDWEVLSFSSLFDFKNGVNAKKESYGYGVPFINVLEPITYSHIRSKMISGKVALPNNLIQAYSVQEGDVIFNRTSETLDEVGLASVYVDKEVAVFGGFVIRGRQKAQKLYPVYAGYALRSPSIRIQIISKGQGAIRANIGQTDLRQVVAPIPSLPEQQAIATALSDVDALISSLEKLIAKKRDIKQATMQQLLTGKKRLPGFEVKKGYKKTELGEIPEDWECLKFGDLLEGVIDNRGKTPPLADEGYPLLEVGSIFGVTKYPDPDKIIKFVSHEIYESWFRNGHPRSGDILIATVGSVGATAYVKELNQCIAQNIIGLKISKKVDSEYLFYFMQTDLFQKQVRAVLMGAVQPSIKVPHLKKFPIVIAQNSKEQKMIVGALADMDSEIDFLKYKLDKTQLLKQGMMQELLTGRIRLI